MIVASLPALEPDLSFVYLPHSEQAFEFTFAAKKEALGPHIRSRWAWEENYQRDVHRARFSEKVFFSILQDGVPIGTLSWMIFADHARFGEFYLLNAYQQKGIGTRVLKHIVEQADRHRLGIRLEYLKWNPVGRLYLRHDFRPTQETENHVFLERAAR
ncbi:GNAT family N-acetyltransferase [Tardiphaga sp.]|uniref:GNAT family N-acetyltransferase n=1 Tax=Tardiphaga sp. TaxID=1926292 RepID=UPI002627F4F9|nr:GNAT family N-acetyltransferase [Tardiphaga sp.]MDB5618976.1 acetyltransferase [Tardiphaga sp.]